MKRVIISLDYSGLKRFFEEDDYRYHYIILDSDFNNLEPLLIENGCKKIEINESIPNFDFVKEFIEFIGRLNVEYNSLCWWANSISSKNPYSSQLFQNIRNYYLIISILKQNNINNVILISKNDGLNNSIKLYCANNLFYCKLLNKRQYTTFYGFFKQIMEGNLFFILLGWRKKYLASKYFKHRIESKIGTGDSFYVLRTWLDSRSFPSPDEYKDIYFGILPQYLTKKGVNLILLGGILKDFKGIIGKISSYKYLFIVPQEYFIGYLDYLNILRLVYLHKINIKNKILFKGEDVTSLVTTQLKEDLIEMKNDLQYYYYIKGLLKQINVHTFTYTFENHSWEKLSILALRKYSPDTKIIGYQHAQVSKYLLNYFHGETEVNVIPMPDKIITVGKETKRILETYGNYKSNILKEGCALRHQYLYEIDTIKRKTSYNILVSLGMLEDSIKLINFLYNSLRNVTKYNLILRRHPMVIFEEIKKRLNFDPNEKFRISNIVNLREDLESADIVIYTSTTVCIEALMMGIPAIHVDLNESICVDPLFEVNYLKWVVTKEEDLPKVIDHIYALDDSEFLELQDKAKKILQSYLCNVDEDKLKEFIE